MTVCGWVAAAAFLSAGSRQDVLAMARPVDRFEELERDDLRVVRVAADPDVGTVPAGRMKELLGRPVASALVEGALLHEDQVLAADARLVEEGEAAVSAVLAQEEAPATLSSGDDVEVIMRAPAGSAAGPQTLPAWVLGVEDADRPGTDSQRVTLVVRARDLAMVSAAAADERVSLAVVGRR